MIKMLLEHIDSGMDVQQKQQQHQQNKSPSAVDCDLCIAFQEAYERILTEKEQLEQVLSSIEREKTTAKIAEKSNVQVQASESNQQQCAKQNKEETVQKVDDDTVPSDLAILFSGR